MKHLNRKRLMITSFIVFTTFVGVASSPENEPTECYCIDYVW